MAVRGRKSLPGNVHKLHGNFRNDRHGGGIKAAVLKKVPDPPARLVDDYPAGAAEWKRLAPELKKLGVLAEVDLTTLEMYCIVYDRWLRAEKDILVEGYMMETPNGYQQQNPAIQVVNICIRQMQSLAAEFGMTPATRARMKIIEKQPEQLDLLHLLDNASGKKASNG